MQYLEIKEIEFSETATLQLIEACSEISTLKSIPEGLGLNSRFLSSEENVDKLIDCINNQEDLKDIEIRDMDLNDYAASRIFEVFYSRNTNLEEIPKELCMNKTVFESEEKVDMLILFIKKQENLKKFDIHGIEMSENFAFKILEACSQLTNFVELDLRNDSLSFKTQESFEMLG